MPGKTTRRRKRLRRQIHSFWRKLAERHRNQLAAEFMEGFRKRTPPTEEEWERGQRFLEEMKARQEAWRLAKETPPHVAWRFVGLFPRGTLYHDWGREVSTRDGKKSLLYRISVPANSFVPMGWTFERQWKSGKGILYDTYRIDDPLPDQRVEKEERDDVEEFDLLAGGERVELRYNRTKSALAVLFRGEWAMYVGVSPRTYRKLIRAITRDPASAARIEDVAVRVGK